MREWIVAHDDRWSFILLYVGLAVVLSLWISLFWLVALVVVHFLFECVRQRAAGASGAAVSTLALWEVKLDIALVLMALAMALYMDVVLGVLGLQAVARAGAATQAGMRTGTRVLAWQRAIRGVALSVDDAAQVGRVLVRGERGAGGAAAAVAAEPMAAVEAEVERVRLEPSAGWSGRWGAGDRLALGLGAACIALIVLAPALTGATTAEAVNTLATELRPFPH
jgi:hypothetical protein